MASFDLLTFLKMSLITALLTRFDFDLFKSLFPETNEGIQRWNRTKIKHGQRIVLGSIIAFFWPKERWVPRQIFSKTNYYKWFCLCVTGLLLHNLFIIDCLFSFLEKTISIQFIYSKISSTNFDNFYLNMNIKNKIYYSIEFYFLSSTCFT